MRLQNGIRIGFEWVHCNGESSHTSACLASYHHPRSITWRWALYWIKPRGVFARYGISRWRPNPDMGSLTLALPLVGALSLSWQAHLFIKRDDVREATAAQGQ